MKDLHQCVKFCGRFETIFHWYLSWSETSRGQGPITWWSDSSALLDKCVKNVQFLMCKTSKHVRFVSHYSSQKTVFCLLMLGGATAEQLPAFWTNTRGHPACAGSRRVTTHCLPPVDIPKYLRGTNRTIWSQVVGDVLLARLTKNLCSCYSRNRYGK